MNETQILQELGKLINETFSSDYTVTAATSAEEVDEWDSISHIELITNIEQHFKIRLALGELQDLKNVGDMARLISGKLA
jgi:acyl carrier protein